VLHYGHALMLVIHICHLFKVCGLNHINMFEK